VVGQTILLLSVRVDIFSEHLNEVIESHPFLHDILKVFKLLEDFDICTIWMVECLSQTGLYAQRLIDVAFPILNTCLSNH